MQRTEREIERVRIPRRAPQRRFGGLERFHWPPQGVHQKLRDAQLDPGLGVTFELRRERAQALEGVLAMPLLGLQARELGQRVDAPRCEPDHALVKLQRSVWIAQLALLDLGPFQQCRDWIGRSRRANSEEPALVAILRRAWRTRGQKLLEGVDLRG